MRRHLYSLFLVHSAICFIAVALGLVQLLHFDHVEDPGQHDSAHCSVCQVISTGVQFHLDPPSIVIQSGNATISVPNAALAAPPQPAITVLAPRPPPPAAAV